MDNDVEYRAKDLNDIADFFDILASDQLACMRFNQSKKVKEELKIKASVYTDCANILRNTKLTG